MSLLCVRLLPAASQRGMLIEFLPPTTLSSQEFWNFALLRKGLLNYNQQEVGMMALDPPYKKQNRKIRITESLELEETHKDHQV